MSVESDIMREEGFERAIYKDTRKVWSLGYGFNVDPEHGGEIPRVVADFWVSYKVNECVEALTRLWAPFAAQPLEVQGALVQMAYQLGVTGVMRFGRMLEALTVGDRDTAAAEALDSDWHTQTPARAERVADIIRGRVEV